MCRHNEVMLSIAWELAECPVDLPEKCDILLAELYGLLGAVVGTLACVLAYLEEIVECYCC